MVRSNPIKIETPAGIKLAELTVKGGRVTAIRVDMGEPLLDKKDIPMKGEGVCRLETIEALGREFTFSAVNTGVPHMAVFGEVTEGLNVVEKIQRADTDDNDRPVYDVRILRAVVTKRGASTTGNQIMTP